MEKWVKDRNELEFKNRQKIMQSLGWKLDKTVRYPTCIDSKWVNKEQDYEPPIVRRSF